MALDIVAASGGGKARRWQTLRGLGRPDPMASLKPPTPQNVTGHLQHPSVRSPWVSPGKYPQKTEEFHVEKTHGGAGRRRIGAADGVGRIVPGRGKKRE